MFRTAIVGCGAVAQAHAEVLSVNGDVKIVALCDIKPERAEKLRDKFNFDAAVYEDYIKMLDEVKPDALHVCTPHYLHAQMAIAALERDIHVMLEKPVCINEEQIKAILKAEKESKACICVSFQNRMLARNRYAKELIESGRVGKPQFAAAKVFWKREAPYYLESGWRGSMATEGGGVMINQAIHTLDLMLCLMGDPVSVTASVSNLHLKGVIEVEDTASAYFTFKNGAHGLFTATTANWTDEPTALTVKCENAVISLHDGDVYIDGKPQQVYDEAFLKNGKPYWGVGHHMLFKEFYSRLKEGRRDMPVPPAEAWRAVRTLLTVYKSNEEEIPLAGEDISKP